MSALPVAVHRERRRTECVVQPGGSGCGLRATTVVLDGAALRTLAIAAMPAANAPVVTTTAMSLSTVRRIPLPPFGSCSGT